MTYNINLTNGDPLVSVPDASVDVNFTSLTLVGKNFVEYGELLNENFVHLLENFASAVEPANPLIGQLWYDQGVRELKLYTATGTWKGFAVLTASPDVPGYPSPGELWWDTVNDQLKAWTNDAWVVAGPLWSRSMLLSGAIPEYVVDIIGIEHVIIKIYVHEEVVGIWSADAAFTLDQTNLITGFPESIEPGLTLRNDHVLHGTVELAQLAENSLRLIGVEGEKFLRSDVTGPQEVNGTLIYKHGLGIQLYGDIEPKDTMTSYIGSADKIFHTGYIDRVHGTADFADLAHDSERLGGVLAIHYLRKDTPDVKQTVEGTVEFSNETSVEVGGNFLPTGTDSSDIGTSALRFNNTYTKNLYSTDISSSGVITTKAIKPDNDNSYSIGEAAKRYKNVYAETFTGKATDADKLDGINSTSFLRSDEADETTGTLTTRSLLPSTDNAYDLGTSAKRYRKLYATSIVGATFEGGISIGGTQFTGSQKIRVLDSSGSEVYSFWGLTT
jgi:hypothetical protein